MGLQPIFASHGLIGGQGKHKSFSNHHKIQNSDFEVFFKKNIVRARENIDPQTKKKIDVFQGETEVPLIIFSILRNDPELAEHSLSITHDTEVVFGYQKEFSVHLAVKSEKAIPFLDLLEKYNVDVNSRNIDGETAFFIVSGHDDDQVGEKLIKMGADPYIPNNDGVTPLNNALMRNAKKMVVLNLNVL